MTLLMLRGLRVHPMMVERLDEVAEVASDVLHRKVSRSAVVRAALQAWIDAAGASDPEVFMAAIKASMVKRGRKPK